MVREGLETGEAAFLQKHEGESLLEMNFGGVESCL